MTPLSFKCDYCSKDFTIYDSRQIKRHLKYTNHFCSVSCSTKNHKSKKSVLLHCQRCNKEFRRSIVHKNRSKGEYCSKKCFYETRKLKHMVGVNCSACGDVFYTLPHLLKSKRTKSGNKYCSIRCRAQNLNQHPYIEKLFESMIPSDLEYLTHDRIILYPLELDFYFPSKNMAVELNGKTHYEPVFGKDKLLKQQKNDRCKKILCKNKGIRLFTVKLGKCEVEKLKKRFQKIIDNIYA